MYDLLHLTINNFHLLFGAANATEDGGDSNTVKVALIGTGGVVVSALLTFFGITFANHKQPIVPPLDDPDDEDDSLAAELTRRAKTAEDLCGEKDIIIATANARIRDLQDYLWEHGVNPYTFKLIGDSSA